MRQISYIVVAITLLFSATNAEAQTIALGERTPRFKKAVCFFAVIYKEF